MPPLGKKDAEGSHSKASIPLPCLIPVASPFHLTPQAVWVLSIPDALHTHLTALFTGPQAQRALPHHLLSPALLL